MDSNIARALIAKGESLTVEFKSDRRQPISDSSIVENVVSLANSEGGVLIVGVEDDGSVTGARNRGSGDAIDPYRVQAMIVNRTVPPLATAASVVHIDDVDVLVIEVAPSPQVVGTKSGLVVRRSVQSDGTPACVPFPLHEILTHEIGRGKIDYAALEIPGITWKDLDSREFDRFRRNASRSGDHILSELDNEQIARALGMLSDASLPLTGALLMFGHQESLRRHIPTHEVVFRILNDTTIKANHYLHTPLMSVAEDIMARLKIYDVQDEIDDGLIRVGLSKLPEGVIRELIANALIHRDYTQLDSIQVQLTSDSLRISSPGGFPNGVKASNLLSVQKSRSPLLADAFRRAGLVERAGRGVNRMYDILLRQGRDAPDYTASSVDSVHAVITLESPRIEFVKLILKEEESGGKFSTEDLIILHEIDRRELIRETEISTLIQKTPTEARMIVNTLIERGYLESVISDKKLRYALTSKLRHQLASHSRIVRQPVAFEDQVLAYLRMHSRITRSLAADLMGVSPERATQVLREMAADGIIEMHGQRRWSYYTLPGAVTTQD